jgi:hypothetical protein
MQQPLRRHPLLTVVPVLAAGMSAVVAAQMIARDPRYLGPMFVLGLLMVAPAVVSRWRTRKLLLSGDVERVIGAWEGLVDRVPHPETMAPLLRATAYASYGWVEAARKSLERASRGPAWEAAVEQRLFVETLLDTFEGNRVAAIHKAEALSALPLPVTGPLAHRRIRLLRRGLAALARAFAHTSQPGDAELLDKAASGSPLVHWAMRYAGAIVAVDGGRRREAQALLAGAPSWPVESAFHTFHSELLEHAAAA